MMRLLWFQLTLLEEIQRVGFLEESQTYQMDRALIATANQHTINFQLSMLNLHKLGATRHIG